MAKGMARDNTRLLASSGLGADVVKEQWNKKLEEKRKVGARLVRPGSERAGSWQRKLVEELFAAQKRTWVLSVATCLCQTKTAMGVDPTQEPEKSDYSDLIQWGFFIYMVVIHMTLAIGATIYCLRGNPSGGQNIYVYAREKREDRCPEGNVTRDRFPVKYDSPIGMKPGRPAFKKYHTALEAEAAQPGFWKQDHSNKSIGSGSQRDGGTCSDGSPSSPRKPPNSSPASCPTKSRALAVSALEYFTAFQLRKACEDLQLYVSGNKEVMAKRLIEKAEGNRVTTAQIKYLASLQRDKCMRVGNLPAWAFESREKATDAITELENAAPMRIG
jgi:hypothetical protein